MIRIVIPGEPVTWKRARSCGTRRYSDPRQVEQADRVRAAARNAGCRCCKPGLFRLSCLFFRPDLDPEDLRFGDADNLVKLVKDALQGVVWSNDRLVVDQRGVKIRDGAGPARTELEIENLTITREKTAGGTR